MSYEGLEEMSIIVLMCCQLFHVVSSRASPCWIAKALGCVVSAGIMVGKVICNGEAEAGSLESICRVY